MDIMNLTKSKRSMKRCFLSAVVVTGVCVELVLGPALVHAQNTPRGDAETGGGAASFQVEEATIDDLHRAIRNGRTTCTAVIRAYVERARAYNGSCTQQVTSDGANITPRMGAVRAMTQSSFPAATVAITDVLPDFDQYTGLPIEYGRLEPTKSDPSAYQQYGMVVGIEDKGQINALSTLNLRGERSVTCKGVFDAHPSTGPLPADAPPGCEAFRQQPDALERAAELDAQYGREPDLQRLPMYCVAFSFKDVIDTTDMRSTGGADVDYAMDAAPLDATVVGVLRGKGAIIYAKANLSEYNGGSGNPGGTAEAPSRTFGAGTRSSWGGSACNPYDTAREPGGSSSGSATSVGANLVECSICEETGGSCRQPAWRNSVVSLVTTKGLIPFGGAIGADPYLDRAGITCRTVRDTALVLDALKDPERGYFDPRDIYTALPKALVSKEPYAASTPTAVETNDKSLSGLRVGIVREYMVKHSANDRSMSNLVDGEIKMVLRDRLGAELVESVDPLYPDDPSIPNMVYDFQQAIAEILPFHMAEILQQVDEDGDLLYAVPGFDVTTRDYLVKVAEGHAPLSSSLNLRSINNGPRSASFGFNLAQYLLRRGDTRVRDWATLNANAKHYSESRMAAMKNWEDKINLASDGITHDVKMREVMRLVILKVMHQNDLDVLVNPTTTIPPARIGYASQPVVNSRSRGRFPTSANLGIPEITVPAGFNTSIFEPQYGLNAAKDDYISVANEDRPSTLRLPLPVGISFWAGPGDEPMVLRVAASYEAVTKHRKAPPAFGHLESP